MFERFEKRVRARAEDAAARRRRGIARQLQAELPRDVAVVIEGDGVRLLARRLLERAALDPEMRAPLGKIR
jgi:hypothetical protein